MTVLERVRAVARSDRVGIPAVWTLTLLLLLVAAESAAGLDVTVALYAGSVATVAFLPVVAARDPRQVVAWEALALATLPVLGRLLHVGVLASRPAVHLAVAGFAILIVAQIESYTAVRMSDGFATVVVVVATLANAAVWTLAQWASDFVLGTAFLGTHDAVMWGFVAAAAAGTAGGVLFTTYFRHVMAIGDGRPREDEA